jgi:hypothetical protein
VEARFLSVIRAVELLFPPIDPMVADFFLTLLGYGGLYFVCVCVYFYFFFFCSGNKAQI